MPSVSDSENPIKIYLREIGEVPLLTPDQEAELAALIRSGSEAEIKLKKLMAAKAAQTGVKTGTSPKQMNELKKAVQAGATARQTMIKSNLRLVVKIAQDYNHYGLPLLDLISEGNIGLMKAVERFEPAKGAKLSTYAAWWIKQAIKRALANQGKTIRLPVHLSDKLSRLRRVTEQLNEEFGREATDDEIAEEMHLAAAKITMLRTASLRPTSLNVSVGGDDEGSELGELVGDESARTPDDLLAQEDATLEMIHSLDTLDPREKEILSLRYGMGGDKPLTLEEVGEMFKITRERVRQIQNVGLRKLRKSIERKSGSSKSSKA